MSDATSTIEIIGPDQARLWLMEYNYTRQRPTNSRRIDTYANDMLMGRWLLSTLDIVVTSEHTYLVNGYHRLHAVVRSQTTQEFNIVRRCVDSVEKLHDEYAVIDQGQKRTLLQAAIGMELDAKFHIPPTMIQKFLSAVAHIYGGFQSSYITLLEVTSVQGRIAYASTWQEEMDIAYATIGYANKARVRKLYSAGVLPLVLVTMRYQRAKALAFWKSVVTLENLRNEHPALTLSDWVANNRVSANEYRRFWWAVTRCWNAYCTGRTIETLRGLNNRSPIDVWGTPYTGNVPITGDRLPSVEEWERRSRPKEIGVELNGVE